MGEQQPVPGRIVYFVFDQYTAEQVTTGNRPKVGDIAPAQVMKNWGSCLNLKVNLDGPDSLWVTSVSFGADHAPRSWHWMYEGQANANVPAK